MRIGIRRGALDPDPLVVADGHQRVDGMQFATRVVGVVHSRNAQAQLETQGVAQCLRDLHQAFATDLDGQFVAEDHDALYCRGERLVAKGLGEGIHHVIEVASVGAR